MSFNNTLQSVANFCSTQSDLLPLTGIGGYANEPFLSIANDALSEIFCAPHDFKFNRVEMPILVTCTNKQDYLFAGAVAFSLGTTSQGWAIDLAVNSAITVSGGVVTVNFLEPHRFAVGDVIYINNVLMTTGTTSAYNSTFTDNGITSTWSGGFTITTISTIGVTFAAGAGQNNGDVGGALGINNFGFLTSASAVQILDTSSPQYNQELSTKRELPVCSFINNPAKVAVINDNNAGVLKIRFYETPGNTPWAAKLIYQAQAPVKVSLGDNWAPIPDHYSALYRQACVYRCYRWLNSPMQQVEYQKLQAEIQKAEAFDDNEDTDVHLKPETPVMDDSIWPFFNT